MTAHERNATGGVSPGPDRWEPTGEANFLWRLWLVAFLVRLTALGFAVLLYSPFLVADDTRSVYYPLARSFVEGQEYGLPGDPGAATRISPLFPLWLSLLMRLGGIDLPLWLPGVFSAMFRSAGVVLVYLLGRRYFGARAGFAGAVLYLIDPWESLWVGYVLKESLAVPLLLLAVWVLALLVDRPSAWLAFSAGATLGLAVLARFANGALLFAAVLLLLGVALSPGPKRWQRILRGLVHLGCLLVGLLLVLSPWLGYTWRMTGQPVLSTEFVGRYLYTSNAPGIRMHTDGYSGAEGMDRSVLGEADRTSAPLDREWRLFTVTLERVLQRPGEWLRRVGAKFINMWQPTFAQASLRNWLVLGLPYILLLSLSLTGVGIVVYRHLRCPVLVVPLLVFVCIHLLYWSEIRNRQYLLPLLLAFGGLTLACWGEWWNRRSVSAAT